MADQEEEEEHELIWGDEAAEASSPAQPQKVTTEELEAQLERTRKELNDVRKELAAKTVQLLRKDQAVSQAQAAAVHAQAQELAANVQSEKERQIQQLLAQVQQLEISLAQREEELDEAKRLGAAQKRALREALASAAEKEALERAADEMTRVAASAVVEEEIERLQTELTATRTRAELELRGREAEVANLRAELAALMASRKQAVSEAEAILTEAWQAELDKVQAEATQRLEESEAELLRLRAAMEDLHRAADSTALASELAVLNNAKVQVQREFEAFKEMATQASRANREEVARLLEENANLRTRLAARAMEGVAGGKDYGGFSGRRGGAGVDLLSDAPPPGASSYSAYAYRAASEAVEAYMPDILLRLERQRKGALPFLIVGSLLGLILTIAIIRAAASAKAQHSGPLCFLAKLGISIGKGCGQAPQIMHEAEKKMAELIDKPHRVHDIDTGTPETDVLPGSASLLPVVTKVTPSNPSSSGDKSKDSSSKAAGGGGQAAGSGAQAAQAAAGGRLRHHRKLAAANAARQAAHAA